MKLLFNNSTVTLEMSREEFHALRDAIPTALEQLQNSVPKRQHLVRSLEGAEEDEVYDAIYEAGFDEGSLQELRHQLHYEEKLLSEVCALRDEIERITEEGKLWRRL